MINIAWLGKKSPFCGNVTYSLATTEALRLRGHDIRFIHFDTPAATLGRQEAISTDADVALPYLVKSQVYTIPSPGARRELRESLERLRPHLVHASLTLSPLDFFLPDLCQQLGLANSAGKLGWQLGLAAWAGNLDWQDRLASSAG